jgi:hypothetical protein
MVIQHTISNEEQAGMLAYRAGEGRDSNPHLKGSEEWLFWDCGYVLEGYHKPVPVIRAELILYLLQAGHCADYAVLYASRAAEELFEQPGKGAFSE